MVSIALFLLAVAGVGPVSTDRFPIEGWLKEPRGTGEVEVGLEEGGESVFGRGGRGFFVTLRWVDLFFGIVWKAS